MNLPYQPLILIGAARSGTKLVRDLVATHPAVDKVPYDINYIWRLGNQDLPHDELSPSRLTPSIRQRIRHGFERYHRGAPVLIEKTVGNCLRVAYVQAVFPEARFIHLVRDGRDVIESAYRQWKAPPDWNYLLDKAKSFPWVEAFGYALSYTRSACLKFITSDKKKVGTWGGPLYAGIDEDVATKELLEVCAIQWTLSVRKALTDLNNRPGDQVLTIRYEDFVQNPLSHLERIAGFIGLDPDPYKAVRLETVSQQNIGKGFRTLSPEQIALVWPYIHEVLSLLNYKFELPQFNR